MAEKFTEKRRSLRLPLDIEDGIFAVLKNPKLGTESIPANILDLSKGGLRLALPKDKVKDLQKGEVLFLTAIVGMANWEFSGHADLEVRWVQKSQIMEHALIGCEFKSIPQAEKLDFEHFIKSEMTWKGGQIMSSPRTKVKDVSNNKMFKDSKNQMRKFMFGSVAILVLVAVSFSLYTAGRETFKKEMVFLHEHIDKIDGGGSEIKIIEERIAGLETREEKFRRSISQTVKSLQAQLDEQALKVDQLKKNTASLSPIQTELQTPQPVKETHKSYHKVNSDETLYRIGKLYGVSIKKLQDLNDLSEDQRIFPGQKLLISSGS